MNNLLKVAIVAAGGSTIVANHFKVHRASVSRWIAGANFPPEHVAQLCAMGGGIVKPEQLTQFLADRAAEQARGKVLERAAA